MPHKSAARLEAERLCREFPDTPSRTLARRLANEFQVTLERARSLVRVTRGNNGNGHLKDATAKRKNGKAGMKPQMPPSLAEPWSQFELKARRIAILSDIHVPYHDVKALAAAVNWCKEKSPDAVLLNGDIGDFYSVSRYQKNPKKRQFSKEIELLRELLIWLRSEFPKQRIVYKLGNHDERWDHWLWNHAPEISDLPQLRLDAMLDMEKLGIEMVGDQRPIMCGHLPVFHGHELPRGISSPVNPARGVYTKMAETGLVGHHHRTSSHAESSWKKDEVFCWSTGCLCDLTPEFSRVNKWNHGFAIVDVANDKSFDVLNPRITADGTVRTS